MNTGRNFVSRYLGTIGTVLAMTSVAGATIAYGLDAARYEDRNKDGRLETYTDVRMTGDVGEFFQVIKEHDGAYRLIPAQR